MPLANAHLSSDQACDAIDATAAGDTCTGTTAAAIAAGVALDDAAHRATVAAATAMMRLGAMASIPTATEADALLADG